LGSGQSLTKCRSFSRGKKEMEQKKSEKMRFPADYGEREVGAFDKGGASCKKMGLANDDGLTNEILE